MGSLGYIEPLIFAWLFGLKIRVLHSHNSHENIGLLKTLIRKINKSFFPLATDYWACSKLAGLWAFGNKHFTVINNAIDAKKFLYDPNIRITVRKELGIGSDTFVIGHVGRFCYQKNQEFIIKIFAEIHKIKPKSVLILIGGTMPDTYEYLQSTLKLVKEFKLGKAVKFLGVKHDTYKLYQAMDCFLLPSRFEGLPLVGIEAQAAGLPCFFSEEITKEAAITDLVNYISLQASVSDWALAIVKSIGQKREKMAKVIIKAGYDVTSESQWVERFFVGQDK